VAGAVLSSFTRIWTRRERWRSRDRSVSISWILQGCPNQLVLTGPIGRIAALAAFDEVAYVLPASADLAAGWEWRGCGGGRLRKRE